GNGHRSPERARHAVQLAIVQALGIELGVVHQRIAKLQRATHAGDRSDALRAGFAHASELWYVRALGQLEKSGAAGPCSQRTRGAALLEQQLQRQQDELATEPIVRRAARRDVV